jgi:hypothetical protein
MAKLEVLKHSPIKGYIFQNYDNSGLTYDYIGFASINGAGLIQRLTKNFSESKLALVDNYNIGWSNKGTLEYKQIFELK